MGKELKMTMHECDDECQGVYCIEIVYDRRDMRLVRAAMLPPRALDLVDWWMIGAGVLGIGMAILGFFY